MTLKLKLALKAINVEYKEFYHQKSKLLKKSISLQAQKMTQNRVQILGIKNCSRAKILTYVENIT